MAKMPKKSPPQPLMLLSDAEAEAAIAEIGRARRAIDAEVNSADAAVAALVDDAAKAVAPLKTEIEQLTAGLELYCGAQRDRLTHGGKSKTVTFATGAVSWRLRPAKVTLRNAKAVLAFLQSGKAARAMRKFLRTTVEIDKEAMLKDAKLAASIKGVTIGSAGEDFAVEPIEAEIEEAAT